MREKLAKLSKGIKVRKVVKRTFTLALLIFAIGYATDSLSTYVVFRDFYASAIILEQNPVVVENVAKYGINWLLTSYDMFLSNLVSLFLFSFIAYALLFNDKAAYRKLFSEHEMMLLSFSVFLAAMGAIRMGVSVSNMAAYLSLLG